jgi:prolipoprotein diacylglyceryltransferase
MREGKRNNFNRTTFSIFRFGFCRRSYRKPRRLRRSELENVFDACYNPAILGSRRARLYARFRFWKGGSRLVRRGLLGAFPVEYVVFAPQKKCRSLKNRGLVIPSVSLGHPLRAAGLYAAGCCFGGRATRRWAISFSPDSMGPPRRRASSASLIESLALYTVSDSPPTQLYESFGECAIFLF